jgi:hypothetical protein
VDGSVVASGLSANRRSGQVERGPGRLMAIEASEQRDHGGADGLQGLDEGLVT